MAHKEEGTRGPGAASNKGSIEIAVAGQRQCGSGPPHARRFAGETGKFRVITCRCDLECASISCAIKIPIRALRDRVRPRILTLGARRAAEVVDHLVDARRSQFVKDTGTQGSPRPPRPINVSVLALHWRGQ